MNVKVSGFTLYELLIIVALLAILSAAALPSLNASDSQKLEASAREVADSIRFARAEAMRTGVAHGVRLDQTPARLRVFTLTTPPTEEYTVYHPLDSQLYDLTFSDQPHTSGVRVATSDFYAVAFNKDGVPSSPTDLSWLATGAINLSYSGRSAVVQVESRTGRVLIP